LLGLLLAVAGKIAVERCVVREAGIVLWSAEGCQYWKGVSGRLLFPQREVVGRSRDCRDESMFVSFHQDLLLLLLCFG
jgi:hypothetical protein